MQKQISAKKIIAPPSNIKNFRVPFLTWKLWVNPIENHINSIFSGKLVIIFQGPLRRVKRAPPTSVCKQSLKYRKYIHNFVAQYLSNIIIRIFFCKLLSRNYLHILRWTKCFLPQKQRFKLTIFLHIPDFLNFTFLGSSAPCSCTLSKPEPYTSEQIFIL